jgi:hypothetical protein
MGAVGSTRVTDVDVFNSAGVLSRMWGGCKVRDGRSLLNVIRILTRSMIHRGGRVVATRVIVVAIMILAGTLLSTRLGR